MYKSEVQNSNKKIDKVTLKNGREIREMLEWIKNFFKKIFSISKNNVDVKTINKKVNIIRNEFDVVGMEDDFIIDFKNEEVEFFVKRGVIVGVKNKKNGEKIYYYDNEMRIDG